MPESDAEGKVKTVFDDVKTTLGVPAVGSLFEELAVYPWYLQLAWRNLKPNGSTVYFHRISGELHAMALQAGGRSPHHADEVTGNISPTEARTDLTAKLLTTTAALRYGTNGQVPKMLWLPPEDKQFVAPRIVDVAVADESAAADEGRNTAELRRHAAVCAESLPYRMEISSTACRQSGLSEDEIDAVQAVINAAWDRLPRTLLASSTTATGTKITSPERVAAS